MFKDEVGHEISLDHAAKRLGESDMGWRRVSSPRLAEQIPTCFSTATLPGVERRRIYDIVNVFEALEIVGRKAKNTYVWWGLDNLDYTLAKLKVRNQ